MKKLLTVVVISFTTSLFGQVAPGGYATALRGWYDASTGYTLSGGAVTAWADQSGNGFHGSQATSADRPVANTTGFNYNQTFTFDGSTQNIGIPDLMASTATGLTLLVVARQTGTGGDANGVIMAGQASPTGVGGGYALVAATAGNNVWGFAVNNYANNIAFAASTLTEPTMLTGNFNGTTAGRLQYFVNRNKCNDRYLWRNSR